MKALPLILWLLLTAACVTLWAAAALTYHPPHP